MLGQERKGQAHRRSRATASVDILIAAHLLTCWAIEHLQTCDLRLSHTLKVFTTRIGVAQLEGSPLDYGLWHLHTYGLCSEGERKE